MVQEVNSFLHYFYSSEEVAMKVLVYVDAENVARDVVKEELKKVKEECPPECEILGKFYGAKSAIETSIVSYLEEGFEFVETSSITVSQKNVTDMKICVDCMHEVLDVHKGDVACVWVFTRDCDFIPLAYKLAGLEVKVHAPLFKKSYLPMTNSDVENALERLGYNPMLSADWMKPQYEVILNMIGVASAEPAVLRYCRRKQRNFLDALRKLSGMTEVEKLYLAAVEKFSIVYVLKCLHVDPGSSFETEIVNLYTRKFFGRNFVSKELSVVIENLDKMIA